MHADWPAVAQTLRVAAAATAISLVLGIWLGHLLEGRKPAALALWVPLPPTIICSYFLVRAFTEQVAIAAATLYWLPALARSARSAFQSVDRRYLDAARVVGASEWRVFWRIGLPLAMRPVLSAAASAFALIAAEYAATLWIAQVHAVRP
jgi:molybdate transport system permease protein